MSSGDPIMYCIFALMFAVVIIGIPLGAYLEERAIYAEKFSPSGVPYPRPKPTASQRERWRQTDSRYGQTTICNGVVGMPCMPVGGGIGISLGP